MNIIEKMKSFLKPNKEHSALTLGDAVPAIVALALIAIVGAVSLLILQNFQSSPSVAPTCVGVANVALCSTNPANVMFANALFSASYNGIGSGISGINTVLSFQGLLGLVVVAAIIIGVVVGAFAFGGRGGREEF